MFCWLANYFEECAFSLPRSLNIPFATRSDLKHANGTLEICLVQCCEDPDCVAVSRDSLIADEAKGPCFFKFQAGPELWSLTEQWNTYFLESRPGL